MFKNRGIRKEEDFVAELNGKKVSEINENLKFNLTKMFDRLDDNEIIKCQLVGDYMKPDFSVTYKNQTKYISLKTGRAVVIHEEYFATLLPFLKSIGISEENLNFFAKYCYGDDSIDGTGIQEFTYLEIKMKYAKEIERFNNEMMKNKDLIKKAVYRFMFKGAKDENIEADYIYYGNVHYGAMCSKQQIFKHIERRKWAYMDNPHIGPLQFKAHYREHSTDPYKEKRRHQCDIWWANLGPDIEYIAERYDG